MDLYFGLCKVQLINLSLKLKVKIRECVFCKGNYFSLK